VLIAAKPRLRISCPTNINTIAWCMIATVNKSDRSTLLTEKEFTVVALGIEIAVDK
jgi:hypothetical protein